MCGIDRCCRQVGGDVLLFMVKAQVSTTWVPCVLMILIDWEARRWTALPWRAGIVTCDMIKCSSLESNEEVWIGLK